MPSTDMPGQEITSNKSYDPGLNGQTTTEEARQSTANVVHDRQQLRSAGNDYLPLSEIYVTTLSVSLQTPIPRILIKLLQHMELTPLFLAAPPNSM